MVVSKREDNSMDALVVRNEFSLEEAAFCREHLQEMYECIEALYHEGIPYSVRFNTFFPTFEGTACDICLTKVTV